MGLKIKNSKNIVTDGLVLNLDASDKLSYSGSGSTWYDRSGNGFNFTMDGSGMTYNSSGYFSIQGGGATYNGSITNNTTCTLVFWIKVEDVQAVFWGAQSNGYYLGAYRSNNKEYHSGYGSPDFYMDTVEKDNIYDYIRDGEWHMLEFKNVNMSTSTIEYFNQYGGFTFDNDFIASIYMYDRNLTAAESLQNYNATKGRFGL